MENGDQLRSFRFFSVSEPKSTYGYRAQFWGSPKPEARIPEPYVDGARDGRHDLAFARFFPKGVAVPLRGTQQQRQNTRNPTHSCNRGRRRVLIRWAMVQGTFWGVEVKPGKAQPYVPPPEDAKLHLSQVRFFLVLPS
jgi:hypothetical protein